ncbi:hypothetical protein HYDPIDRAFT_114199 [Hydnomerulius pinastri MD-312]|uniref:Unplaced genomic scaffold scaffold_20, whole genome shotgun sequence n=1 Tax=Hydnomerulius pinastri MD-312 TaxID=994086 RepID=A0A0C9WCY7_9AGAM|nr:hypothetical protein HYDPIDRAFT_114199 [Hydnomerulius pinastri MD-312]
MTASSDSGGDEAVRESLYGHEGPVYCLALSPDGAGLASGARGHEDIGTRQLACSIRLPKGYAHKVASLGFLSNEQYLARGSLFSES